MHLRIPIIVCPHCSLSFPQNPTGIRTEFCPPVISWELKETATDFVSKWKWYVRSSFWFTGSSAKCEWVDDCVKSFLGIVGFWNSLTLPVKSALSGCFLSHFWAICCFKQFNSWFTGLHQVWKFLFFALAACWASPLPPKPIPPLPQTSGCLFLNSFL